MKNEDLEKTNEELKEEIKNNNEIIASSDRKAIIVNANQFEYKFLSVFPLFLFSYLGLLGAYALLAANGIFASVPTEIIALVISGSSLGIGTVGNEMLDRKLKVKEKFNEFSNAKTQYEKLEEEIKYTIESEKAKNRNKVVKEAMNLLISKQIIFDSLSNKYNFFNENNSHTIEESKEIVDKLSKNLKDRVNELDVLSTKKVLHEKFLSVRMKYKQVIDIMVPGLLSGLLLMLMVNFPFIIARVSETVIYGSIAPVLAPMAVGITGVSGYMVKKNKDYKRLFDKLNNDLGENALPAVINEAVTEKLDIDNEIEDKIIEVGLVEAQLQEQKRIMESFVDSGEEIEKEKDNLKAHTSAMTKADKIIEYNCEHLVELMAEGMSDITETTSQVEEKASQLSLRK